MTPSQKSKPVSISQRHAIGNLLRIADACIRDGGLLLRGGRSSNVAMLVGLAAARMVEAVLISERGQIIPSAEAGSESLDDENPIKAELAALAAHTHQEPPLFPDGKLRKMPDGAVLRDRIDQAAAVLTAITEHFEVNLAGQGPAGHAEPMRPEPVAPAVSASTPVAHRPSRREALSDPGHAVPGKPSPTTARQEAPSGEPAPPRIVHAPATQPSRPSSDVSSVSFWSLMDRWNVADLDALALLGHTGGLTRKGTRPRFKLNDAETDMLIRLQDIDEALTSARLDPRQWLREAVAAAPLHGATPLAFITQNRLTGARDLAHYIFRQGLRLSLGNS